MKHAEIIVDSRPSASERHALSIAAQHIGERLVPLAGIVLNGITMRYSDTYELANINQAQIGLNLNTYSYLVGQRHDRQRHNVSSDTLSVLVTSQPLTSIQPNRRVVANNSFGHSIDDYHEAIVSTARYTGELRKANDIHQAIGFTAVHEIGHLLGLVPENSKRSTPGKHCSNNCVMQSPASVKEVLITNERLPKKQLCLECLLYAL